MESSFTWLDHSESDRRKALDIIDLFRERGTLDELGIGTVRDALADTLFPGISTLQTRAKYLLFIPWIYRALEENKTSSSDIAKLARKLEVDLIYQLLETDDTNGVIGKEAKSGLQRLPSNVYWSGLRKFGIRQFQGSKDYYHRSLDKYYQLRQQSRSPAERSSDEFFQPESNWHEGLPHAPNTFPKGASLKLSGKEAEYLREQFMTNVQETLIAFLVDQGKSWKWTDYPWHHPQLGQFSECIRNQLHHADLFSLTMHGATLLYNLMLAEKQASNRIEITSQSDNLVDEFREKLSNWFDEVNNQRQVFEKWCESQTQSDFWYVVRLANPNVPERTKQFINSWIFFVSTANDFQTFVEKDTTRNHIQSREKILKDKRARLSNPRALEMWSGDVGTQRLSYRWPQVQTITLDILKGLERGRRSAGT